MPIELRVPEVGESITEVQLGEWYVKEGDAVKLDDPLVEVESDKATLDLPSPAAGVVTKILKQKGETAEVGEIIGHIDDSEGAAEKPRTESKQDSGAAKEDGSAEKKAEKSAAEEAPKSAPKAEPAAKAQDQAKPEAKPQAKADPATRQRTAEAGEGEEVVAMSPMRRRIAERLVASQQSTASLTTFNEVDMSAVMAMRSTLQELFQKRHGIKLGFMSFFVKAAIEALKEIPGVNAEIRGDSIVYHHRYDIGVAVGTERGLVVPVVRNADRLSFAEIEKTIADLAVRAREKKIELHELQGGTFTISNGGVYGSMLSTPILNPPQSGILGLHNIQKRAVVDEKDQIVVRPMMYLALTYDHRLIDGREAVTFLRRLKDLIEQPARMMLEI